MSAAQTKSPRAYVYHRVPPHLRGSVLYPLNRMQDIFPDLYAELRKNYATREDIASLRIPPLGNCLWNDVLHFSPVHPLRLQAALADVGHALPEGWKKFFQVDARLFDESLTVIYKLSRPFWSGHFDVEAASQEIGDDCLPFKPEWIVRFGDVPSAARDYYASVAAGSGVALFLGIPHVLYKGEIDTQSEGVSIIEV